MMECKKALVEANGDIETAIETMRRLGQAKADKKATRVAAEGLVVIEREPGGKTAAMVEVNCETDFVARGEGFRNFVVEVAKRALRSAPSDLETLLATAGEGSGGTTVEDLRQELISRIGENITVRRFTRFATETGRLGAYLHGGRIGVVVEMTGGDEGLGKDIAMHIAASRPLWIAAADVPAEILEKERDIFRAQSAASGKPPEIIEKMAAGRLKKYLDEVTLLGQPFIKDPDITVQKLLADAKASVQRYVRFEVGEGLEKKPENVC
jgi:elongation factor Ts